MEYAGQNPITYKEMIELLLGSVPERGQLLVTEIRKRSDFLDELERSNGTLLMTEEQYSMLSTLANQFNWGTIARNKILGKTALRAVRSLVNDIDQAESIEIGKEVS